MNQTLKPNSWRTFAFKMAVLCLIWTLLATTFAAQFYWIGQDLPLKISWKESFLRSLIEWCPWMILSPAVMWLAERCRFDRARWFWGVFPHLPACVLVVLAYQGISMLLMQRQAGVVFHSSGGNVRVINNGSGEVQGFGSGTNFPPGALPPHRVFTRSVRGESVNQAADRVILGVEGGASVDLHDLPPGGNPPGPASSGAMQVLPPQTTFVRAFAPPFAPGMPGPWTRFLHLATARAQSTIPIYWAIVCVTWVISYYQQLRERERHTLELEARLTQANLQTLKTQLQPHFLFNTLNAIASLVRRKPDAAEDMIGSLSEFLRMNLDTAQQHEVPLRREIEFLDLYLEIQQTRFGERLRIQKEIDPAVLDVAVPTLILQPLVENSVRHGIEPRETGGTILIRALRQDNSLRVEVRDDGEGLKGGQLAAIREGVGLSNTKARLQELYGDAHRFQITPNADGGLTVAVEFPWRMVAADG
jgi:two-component sensor histidine kinase